MRDGDLLRSAALRYAALGWPLVPGHWIGRGACSCGDPACSSPGKHPRTPHGCKDATVDPGLIAEWWRRWPRASVMLATGAAAGFWVLDIDPRHGGEEALAELAQVGCVLPPTLTAASGGGGRHLYFRWIDGTDVRSKAGALGSGLDTRGTGGLIVAPPSRHLSGDAYAWMGVRVADPAALADPPAWLLDRLAPRSRQPRPARLSPPARDLSPRAAAYVGAALDGEATRLRAAPEGTRNETLFGAARSIGSLVGASLLDEDAAVGKLAEAATATGLPPAEIARTLASGLRSGAARPRDLSTLASKRFRLPNPEAQAARRKRLRESPDGVRFLTDELGFDDETVREFDFGLDAPYESRATGLVGADSLTVPVRDASGRPVSTFCRVEVPGLTRNPQGRLWHRGEPMTFHAFRQGEQNTVVVVDLLDLWRLWQEFRRDEAAPQLIASSSGAGSPPEWRDPRFWARWEQVVVAVAARDAGELALGISRCAGRPVRFCPLARSWIEHFTTGGSAVEVLRALADAEPVTESVPSEDSGGGQPGRGAYKPIDIGRSFHRGHLYYPVDTLLSEREVDEHGVARIVEHRDTVIVRTDGALLSIIEVPAPRGTPTQRRVLRLSDGTLIGERPETSAAQSWSWPSIVAFREARQQGRKAASRPLGVILAEILALMRGSFWLPYDEDYATLALTVAASYSQAVYEAVPLILLCGPPGSGKSTIGVMMANLSANGTIVGQVSAASVARLIHETRGLVVLDDLEGIASKSTREGASYSELVQWLKVSYNRSTAVKVWTDTSRGMAVRQLNGFGIKVINNTTGTDAILGTRMVRILTQRMPPAIKAARRALEPPDLDRLHALRDELHTWTFENVTLVDRTYRSVSLGVQERDAQIAAPLRALAALAGDEALRVALEATLARMDAAALSDEPEELLREAATALARQGYREVSPTHLILEFKRLVDAHFGKSSTTEIAEWERPEWVGRMLRLRDIVDPGAPGYRKRFLGKNLRIYPFSRNFLAEVLGDGPPPEARDPTGFCAECVTCPYRSLGCSLMEARMGVPARTGSRPR